MVSCGMCLQSVVINLIILIWSLLLDTYFIHENRGIKSGLVYCELEGWILPAYSLFTSIGLIIVCIQLILLIFCCGCLKEKECLRVRSYTIDICWAIIKEVPQIMIIFRLNLCRDGWFKSSSLVKAIFSILITLWKLYNLKTFLREDIKSNDIPDWCRAKRFYLIFPIILIPVWVLNLALSIMIAILFIHRSHGAGVVSVAGSTHSLQVPDEYLYQKYIVHSGIYLSWPAENNASLHMKLSEIDYIMANNKVIVRLQIHMPYVCFERPYLNYRPYRCYEWNNQTNLLKSVSNSVDMSQSSSFSFTFRYRPPSNKFNLGQIVYQAEHSATSLYLKNLLYFRLHHAHIKSSEEDLLDRTSDNLFQFYMPGKQLIPIKEAWRHGLAKCFPCVTGPQLIMK